MKKLLAIVMTFAIAFGICSLAFATEDGFITTVDSVTDVPEGWTAIRTAEDLNNIRNDLAGKYILMNDIDLSVYDNWSPIGDATTPFTGTLDGNGYTIENMKITIAEDEEAEYAAFFGATQNATISNLTIVCDIDVLSAIGSDKHIRVAAFVGRDIKNTQIINCVADGSILINTDLSFDVGGIATSFSGYMNGCRNNTDLNIKSSANEMLYCIIGGLVGYNEGKINKSANTGNISASYDSSYYAITYIGGICGTLGIMSSSSETGCEIVNCYNVGNISVNNFDLATLGGISGFVAGNIISSYNYGKFNYSKENTICDSLGGEIIFWSEDPLGIGDSKEKMSEFKNCYYVETDDVRTYDEELAVNVKMLTAEEFSKQESFVGFDFETVWVMDEELGRPVFIDENEKEIVTESTTQITTQEPTTQPVIQESTTELPVTESTTQEATIITEAETTQAITDPVIETTTKKESITSIPTTVEPISEETTTEITTPANNDCSISELWIVRVIKQICFNLKKFLNSFC